VVYLWKDSFGNVAGTSSVLQTFTYGTFSLEVQPINSIACAISPKEFEIAIPVLSVDLTLSSSKLCELGPRAILDLSSTFPDEITDVEWRRYDANGTIEELPQFKNKYQVIVDQEGTYEAAVFSRIPEINKNCELGRKALKIDLIPERVEIQIPGDLSICDPYELTPTSPIPLEYTLTFPDGTVENKSSGQSFTLNQEGTYTLFGIDPNPNGPKCPEQKTFKVKVNPPVQFNPVFQTLNCDGSYRYQAKVDNYPADSVVYLWKEVVYLWKDSFGNVAGTSSVLQTFTYGTFSLEVQPKGSIPCTSNPISFDIPVPILNIDVVLSAEPLCPDQPNAALTVNTDFAQVSLIEWWFTDINNNTIQLTSETDKKEIAASQNGTYEVLVKNSFGCILGQDQLLVLRSTDQVRPELKEKYLICPNLQIGPNLNPGNFASYEWYFEGRLVSSDPIFKPLQLGAYDLFVQSQEGCVYQATFTTAEECDPKLRIPDAIQPENPDKQFLIYTNYLVDELELYIYNKWGNLIFHCKKTELIDQESTCVWDGTYRGEKVPAGTYVYRVNYKNIEKNIQKTESNSFLVID
ncbi:MAG: gliding motility-associated C-terminal domain-containing protein, partial [Algoriphagus sp.]|nr:gliding motility-associated C-terminal domain-containing protein [Algoriphagus sp.]